MIVDIFMNVDPISRNFESFSRFTINDINKFVIAFAGKFTEIEKYQREMKINNPEYLVSDDRVILKYHIKENQNVRLEINADKFNINSCVLVKDGIATIANYTTLLEGTDMWQKLMKKTFKTSYETSLIEHNAKLDNFKNL